MFDVAQNEGVKMLKSTCAVSPLLTLKPLMVNPLLELLHARRGQLDPFPSCTPATAMRVLMAVFMCRTCPVCD